MHAVPSISYKNYEKCHIFTAKEEVNPLINGSFGVAWAYNQLSKGYRVVGDPCFLFVWSLPDYSKGTYPTFLFSVRWYCIILQSLIWQLLHEFARVFISLLSPHTSSSFFLVRQNSYENSHIISACKLATKVKEILRWSRVSYSKEWSGLKDHPWFCLF